MSFGLTNAPATFQHIIPDTLRKRVLVYFNDVLIYSNSWFKHLEKLEEVLGIMREHVFFGKRSNCSFNVDNIEDLGFFIS